MSPIRAGRSSRFAGRRLSVTRLLISFVGFAMVSATAAAAILVPQLPTAVVGAPVDERWFASYYDVTLESGEQLARSALGTSSGGVVLAFVVAAAEDDCTPTWGRAYSLDDAADTFQLDRRIERMQLAGKPVAASFGGAINTELASACQSVDDLTDAYRTVMDRYGIDVMDLDIEAEMLTDQAATQRRADAVAQLQRERRADGGELDVWLTLAVSPQGLTADGLAQIDAMLDAGVQLAGVNAMTMNFGTDGTVAAQSSLSVDALRAMADQLTELWGAHERELPYGGVWALVGATPMIGRNDVEGEIFSLDDARALNAFATEQGMARLSMWSLNRDQTCGTNYPYVEIVSVSCSGVEQSGEFFADVLAEGYSGTPSGRDLSDEGASVVEDDPDVAPFPIWSSQSFYSAGVSVVWHGSVYVSKWWNEDGPQPDDPSLDAAASPWTYIGPVLASDTPFSLPQIAAGTYPEWSDTELYNQGDKVMYNGSGYEARWWSRGQKPDRSVLDRDYSPWKLITSP